jgi:hypothetical protein
VATLVSPAAQAQIIPLPRAEIEDRVEMAVECYINPTDSRPDCPLYWASEAGSADRVQISYQNATTLNADVHLKCAINNFANPDVYLHLDLAFSCFWLTPNRDRDAAEAFLRKAIRTQGLPEKITIDQSGANTAAIERYNRDHHTAIIIRHSKYLNNLIEIVFTQMTKSDLLAAKMVGST